MGTPPIISNDWVKKDFSISCDFVVESLAKFVEQRLRPYDYELELSGIVNALCNELNYIEISQETDQRLIYVFNYEEKGHLNFLKIIG